MKLFLTKDYFDNPIPPSIYLCNTSKRIIGELPAYDSRGSFKWNTYSEVQFSVDRTYVDVLTGETKVHPLFDKIESPRNVYVKNIGYFSLQDIDANHGDKDSKTVTAFSLEYSTLGTKYLKNFKINKGDVDSKEVIYLASQYGEDYSPNGNDQYSKATGAFDPYESYYIKDYTDNKSFTWTQVEIRDASVYATYDGSTVAKTLYVQKYPRVRFYYPTKPELSLLHLILENVPEWKIGNVDAALWRKERSFDESRVAVYDFLTSQLTDTFNCIVEFDSLSGVINFYEEVDDGITEDNEVATRWKTDVVVSKDNLASEINVSYSADNIKTKLTVSGADDLNISEINIGRNEIMNLSFYHSLDWMEPDLFEAYSRYLASIKEAETGLDAYGVPSSIYPMSYSDATQKWVAANNRYHEIMNEVPAEDDVVLVGDEFKKLYCMFTPIDTAFTTTTIPEASPPTLSKLYYDKKCTKEIAKATLSNNETFVVQGYAYKYNSTSQYFEYVRDVRETALTALVNKLNDYHVDDDIAGNKNDNVLLKLKSTNADTVTIRIYDPKRRYEGNYNEKIAYYKQETSISGVVKYDRVYIKNATEFTSYDKNSLYTNNYTIKCIVTNATSGLESVSYWSMANENLPDGVTADLFVKWVRGDLTAETMGLADNPDTKDFTEVYTVSYIGTMGAYFVITENEFEMKDNGLIPSKDYLRTYGVNLLKEKHSVYTTIFTTQTEALYSQQDYQCTASAEPPTGTVPEGTRWLDTDSNPPTLYKRVGQSWVSVQTDANTADLENYQRYIDNYQKLQAVQEVLLEKEREAEYCNNGHIVPDRKIVLDAGDGSSLDENMRRVAQEHFKGHTITRRSLNANLPLYTFTTSYDPISYIKDVGPFDVNERYYVKEGYVYKEIKIDDQDTYNKYNGTSEATTLYLQKGHEYAVYLKGTTPYVAYADSLGVYQMIRDYIRNKTEMSNFFNEDQWIRLSPFIREDEFNDSNFFWTEQDSEEMKMYVMNELLDAANKELNTLCQPSLEFSMTMANILALPEFAPLVNQFQLGNFIRVHIRDGYIKRARLLEVDLSFDDLSDFSCTFGNLVTTKSEIDKHAELLAQAVSAGKQVAVAASSWQRAVDKSNKLEEAIENGLQDAALQVGRASGQAITWDENGFYCRKFLDGSTDQYEDEQMAIINNKIVFTNDGWKTSKAALGEFQVDINGDGVPETMYGLISDAVISGYIKGSTIEGGSLKIGGTGGTFVVNEDGSVQILGPDAMTPAYVTKELLDEVEGTPGADAVTFQIYSNNGYALSSTTPTITLHTIAYIGNIEITTGTYQWYKNTNNAWVAITNSTQPYLTVTTENSSSGQSYMCKLLFNGVEYVSVATIDDKTDVNKVFITKPSNYTSGDIWIVGVDYIPSGFSVGTILKSEHTNSTYANSDWVTATSYDERIASIKKSLDTYNQYFSFDSQNGLKISARNANGAESPFSTSLTNERLSFNQGSEAVAYIESNKLKIKEAEVESPLTVTGKYSGSTMLQAPIINIGNFSIVVESNGSLSIVANT